MSSLSTISSSSLEAYRTAIRSALGFVWVSNDKIEIIRNIILPGVEPHKITLNACYKQAQSKWENYGQSLRNIRTEINQLLMLQQQKEKIKETLEQQIRIDERQISVLEAAIQSTQRSSQGSQDRLNQLTTHLAALTQRIEEKSKRISSADEKAKKADEDLKTHQDSWLSSSYHFATQHVPLVERTIGESSITLTAAEKSRAENEKASVTLEQETISRAYSELNQEKKGAETSLRIAQEHLKKARADKDTHQKDVEEINTQLESLRLQALHLRSQETGMTQSISSIQEILKNLTPPTYVR